MGLFTPATQKRMGTRGSILLADDEVMVRNACRTALQNDGYTVLVAADGGEALELSRTSEGSVDLLLTDVRMPMLDGVSLYRQITTERPNIKVLFTSGGSPVELPQRWPSLRKPFRPDSLRSKVNEILQSLAPPGKDLKVILVVDHDWERREHTKGILIDADYAVMTAGSVDDAEAIADSIARIDLIVSGVVFPGLSGVHLAEHVAGSIRQINTLLISHFSRDLLRTDVPGFEGQPEFLPNPFTREALLSRVRRLLE